jgi:hypothetical protein
MFLLLRRGLSVFRILWMLPVLRQAGIPAILFSILSLTPHLSHSESPIASVVGSERQGIEREKKRGLVLLPFKHEFGENDGDVVARITSAHRNYSAGVTHLANTVKTAQNITLEDYMNWDQYDFVYLSTHGLNINGCWVHGEKIEGIDPTQCRTLLYSGIRVPKKEWESFKSKYENKAGLGFLGEILYINDQFFAQHYSPGSLKNTILFLDACELGQYGEFPELFRSLLSDAQLLYWSNAVQVPDSLAAAKHLYNRMVKDGVTLQRAYEEMPSAKKNRLKSEQWPLKILEQDLGISVNDTLQTYTDLKLLTVGKPQHLIEPITLLNKKTGQPLKKDDLLVFSGFYGDGKPERINLALELKGYTWSEIEEAGMEFSLVINGKTALDRYSLTMAPLEAPLITVEPGPSAYRHILKLHELDIGQDIEPQSYPIIEVYFHLSKDNDAYQQLRVRVGNPDLRVEMQDGRDRVTLRYEAAKDAIRVEAGGEAGTIFADKEGYMIMRSEGRWMKVRFGAMANMAKMLPMAGVKAIEFDTESPTPLHRIAYFPVEATIAALDQHPELRRISGKDAPKVTFSGPGGVRIQFNTDDLLEEIRDGRATLRFHYEPQSITIPAAMEMPIGPFW